MTTLLDLCNSQRVPERESNIATQAPTASHSIFAIRCLLRVVQFLSLIILDAVSMNMNDILLLLSCPQLLY